MSAPPMSAPARARLSEAVGHTFIPSTGPGRSLALVALVDSTGTGMFVTGASLFYTKVLGLTSSEVGIGLSIAGLAGLVCAAPIGRIADRVGPGRVAITLQAWRGVGYLAFVFVRSFPAFVVVATLIGLVDAAVPPVNQALVAAVAGEDRMATMAKVRGIRNIGFGLGALLGAAAAYQASNTAFLALVLGNACSFFAVGFLLHRAGFTRFATATTAGGRMGFAHNLRYVAAATLNGALSVHITLLGIGLPLWIVQHTRVPPLMIGVIIVVNTLMAAGLQARTAGLAAELRGAVRCMRWAGMALAATGVLAYAMGKVTAGAGIALALGAVVAMTVGELLQSVGAWSISYSLARPDRQAQYLATFYLGTASQSVIGPWLILGVVIGHSAGWLWFAVAMVVAGQLFAPVVTSRGGAALQSQPA